MAKLLDGSLVLPLRAWRGVDEAMSVRHAQDDSLIPEEHSCILAHATVLSPHVRLVVAGERWKSWETHGPIEARLEAYGWYGMYGGESPATRYARRRGEAAVRERSGSTRGSTPRVPVHSGENAQVRKRAGEDSNLRPED
jgi:hypothetical protein